MHIVVQFGASDHFEGSHKTDGEEPQFEQPVRVHLERLRNYKVIINLESNNRKYWLIVQFEVSLSCS